MLGTSYSWSYYIEDLSYLLTCEVYLTEVLEIMAHMWQYLILILNYLKKVVGGATTQNFLLNHKGSQKGIL